MGVVYKTGDVLASNEKIIIHGCNCFNTMGSGIAKQVREQFPLAYEIDQKSIKGSRAKLGTYTAAVCGPKLIINAYTQFRYGTERVHADYNAIEKVLRSIVQDFKGLELPFALPKIGCGLAGGDWTVVSSIIEKIADEFNVTFHVYEFNGMEINRHEAQ